MPALVAALAAGAGGVACTGEDGGPIPRPFEPTSCALLWYRAREQARFDLYKVELPASAWTTGTHSYDPAVRLGVFYYGLADADGDGLFEQWQDAATASAGEFSLVVDGLDEGDAVSFTDQTPQTYFAFGDVPRAVGGTGSFSGVWSTPEVEEGATPTWADSAILSISYLGSSLTLGTGSISSFGYCWADPLAIMEAGWRADAVRS